MDFKVPRVLPFQGRVINFAGRGRSPGGLLFVDPVAGKTLELFLGQVVRVGPHFALAHVEGNGVLGSVRVDYAALNGCGAQVGQVIVLGPIAFVPEGPRAEHAWRPEVAKPVGQRKGEKTGVVVYVAPDAAYGRVLCEQTGREVFVHRSQLARGLVLRAGLRVSFVEGDMGRGPAAFAVQQA